MTAWAGAKSWLSSKRVAAPRRTDSVTREQAGKVDHIQLIVQIHGIGKRTLNLSRFQIRAQ